VDDAFNKCSLLEHVRLPSSVNELRSGAFSHCLAGVESNTIEPRFAKDYGRNFSALRLTEEGANSIIGLDGGKCRILSLLQIGFCRSSRANGHCQMETI
jgi:hypothetical protein